MTTEKGEEKGGRGVGPSSKIDELDRSVPFVVKRRV